MLKKYLTGIFTLSLFLYLLLCPAESLEAVRNGLLLWYHSVLPVLFPFMILSGIITRLHLTEQIPRQLLRPVRRLFGCSHQGCLAILTGFLCGFPVGARVTHDLKSQGLISQEEADRLYGFVNNVSPAFLVSFLAQEQLNMPQYRFFFLFCVLGASALYGLMSGPYKKTAPPAKKKRRPDQIPEAPSVSFTLIDDCIQDAVTSTVKLGAYITIFSLLNTAAGSFLSDSSLLHAVLSGFLEITNGTAGIISLDLPWEMKAVWLCAVCSFGGLSAFVQTVSIASMDRRTACGYLKSRVKITLLASLLSFGILFLRRLLFIA